MATCPFCRASVTPQRTADGKLVCPACNNTGQPVQPPVPAAAPWPAPQPAPTAWPPPEPSAPAPWLPLPASPVPQGRARGALASLILGIVSFPLYVFGIATAIPAIITGIRARRRVRESGGHLSGGGMALAGQILGWVYLGLVPFVVLAAVVFVLVQNLSGAEDTFVTNTLHIPSGDAWLQGFPVGDGATYRFEVEATNGIPIAASLRPVDDWMDPDLVPGASLWEDGGLQVGTTMTFTPGDYALVMVCEEVEDCAVRYRITREDPAASRSEPTTGSSSPAGQTPAPGATAPGTTAGSGCPPVPAAGNTARVASWQPDAEPGSGSYLVVDGDAGARFGAGHRVYSQQDHAFDDDAGRAALLIRAFLPDNQGYAWTLDLRLPAACGGLQEGMLYPLATGDGSEDPPTPRLQMIVDDVRCQESRASFVVDELVADSAGNPIRLVMRIEFHCQREAPAAMAKLVWEFQ